jgi:cell division protein FtsQ
MDGSPWKDKPMGHKENNRDEERDSFEETPYLRRQRAISVKRTQVEPSKLVLFSRIFLALVVLVGLGISIRHFAEYATTSPKFDLNIREVKGLRNLSEAIVMPQLAPLIGQNIFRANYNERIRALMQIPWVESVVFLRFWPASLSVIITERVPVGYALIGGAVVLIDKEGVPLGASTENQQHFDFPIVRGLAAENTTNDHVINRLRISRYMELLEALESGREGYSADLSEVDVSEPEDVRVILKNDPILVHLGKDNLLPRFKLYLANIKKLKQDYPDIDAVDLRFKDQIIIKRQETSREVKTKTST